MIEAIRIGNKTINMKATANTPRKYRALFNKDLIVEMGAFMAHLDKKTGEFDSNVDFGFIERLAYTMASQCEEVGSIDDWLDQFEMFSIYEVLPEILELWGTNLITDVNAKKNLNRVAGK